MQTIDDDPEMVFVIIVPCGHLYCCDMCAFQCKENKGTCPICRAPIDKIITKADLQ